MSPTAARFPLSEHHPDMPHTFIPATLIEVPETRQRTEFDEAKLLELATSIRERGLIHAITVRPDGKTLVAGERRLRAIKSHLIPLGRAYTYGGEAVPPGHVPVVLVASDDPLELAEIEWAENDKRTDLTWQERSINTAKLDAMRAERAHREGKTHTHVDTAVALGRPTEAGGTGTNTTRIETIVARHLDNPEVKAAKTLKEAFKVLKRQEEHQRVRDLGVAVGKTFSSAVHAVHNENCISWMQVAIAAGLRFDVLLTDPPYGMGADQFGDGAGRLAQIEHHYDDSYESWVKLLTLWAPLSYAIAKPQAHAYVFCDLDRFHELKRFMESVGWYVFRTPLINVKRNSGRVPLPTMGPRRQYEIALYAIKGDKETTAIYSDVVTTDADEQLSHGAQKPVALFVDFLRRSIRPGDLVLDTFAGSGTLLPAAHALKCKATLVEMNPTYYGMCLERLANLDEQAEIAL